MAGSRFPESMSRLDVLIDALTGRLGKAVGGFVVSESRDRPTPWLTLEFRVFDFLRVRGSSPPSSSLAPWRCFPLRANPGAATAGTRIVDSTTGPAAGVSVIPAVFTGRLRTFDLGRGQRPIRSRAYSAELPNEDPSQYQRYELVATSPI